MPAIDDGRGRVMPARLRPGHKFSKPAKDDRGRYFAVCDCTEIVRAATPSKLSAAVAEHLVERVPDGN